MPHRIAVVVGSLRRDSFNKQLAATLAEMATGLELVTSRIDDLPLYNQDHDKQQAASVLRLKGEVSGARGVIFVTPEYNRSIPGVLKNALDHGSRPYGTSCWAGKPAGVIGISPGQLGTAIAQQHLRTILANLDMPTLGQPEMFLRHKADFFTDEDTRKHLQKWLDKYSAWVERHAK